ncbi:MAG: TRAP transporter small permease subunit [Oceanospirillales bacterium]|nr:MAG: TRAP transporter small permease subunit [Oceanospirillales bacterium]
MSASETKIEIDLEKVEESSARGHGLDFPRTWLSDRLEWFLGGLGSLVSFIWIALVLIIVGTVAMRHFVGGNTIAIEEAQWHLYAFGFLIGIGYAIIHDSHVRVDVLASNFQPTTRAVIEFLGISLIILPMVWLVVSYAIPFVQTSFVRAERSASPGGLSNRWLIKGVIIFAFVYIGLSALSRLLRVTAFLYSSFGGRELPKNIRMSVNLVLLAAIIWLVALPFQQVSTVFAPQDRDIVRAIAGAYDLRRVSIDQSSCSMRPGLRFGAVSAEEPRSAPLVFGWHCYISGVTFTNANIQAMPDERIFGLPLDKGPEASGVVRFESRYNPITGFRVRLDLTTDPRLADQ